MTEPLAEPRDRIFNFRVTESEKRAIEEQVRKRYGRYTTPTAVIRDVVLRWVRRQQTAGEDTDD